MSVVDEVVYPEPRWLWWLRDAWPLSHKEMQESPRPILLSFNRSNKQMLLEAKPYKTMIWIMTTNKRDHTLRSKQSMKKRKTLMHNKQKWIYLSADNRLQSCRENQASNLGRRALNYGLVVPGYVLVAQFQSWSSQIAYQRAVIKQSRDSESTHW